MAYAVLIHCKGNLQIAEMTGLFMACRHHGADPCRACSHYEMDGLGYGQAPVCDPGDPAKKYAAKAGTTERHIAASRMQIGSTHPAASQANRGRWGYQESSECYTPGGLAGSSTDEWRVYRCVRR